MEELFKSISFSLGRSDSSDPVCKGITDDEINNLIEDVAKTNGLNVEDLDITKSSYIRMLVMRELYWKLALASAPLYEISIDGLKVAKQSRFEHYFKLIDLLQKQIKDFLESNPSLGFGSIKVATSVISKEYINPILRKSLGTSEVKIYVDKQDETYTYLTLGMSSLEYFNRCQIYISDEPIVDPYNGLTINKKAEQVSQEYTFHEKVKVPIITGYIAVLIQQTNGVDLWKEIKVGDDHVTD